LKRRKFSVHVCGRCVSRQGSGSIPFLDSRRFPANFIRSISVAGHPAEPGHGSAMCHTCKAPLPEAWSLSHSRPAIGRCSCGQSSIFDDEQLREKLGRLLGQLAPPAARRRRDQLVSSSPQPRCTPLHPRPRRLNFWMELVQIANRTTSLVSAPRQ